MPFGEGEDVGVQFFANLIIQDKGEEGGLKGIPVDLPSVGLAKLNGMQVE